MESKKRLQSFLDSHRADGVFSHTLMGNPGGKFFIPEDETNEFYTLYVQAVLDDCRLYLTERPREVGPLRIDFDFIYEQKTEKHLHTQEQVVSFTKAYMDMMKGYLNLPENVDVYVMEKRRPTFDQKKQRYKSGIHIVVPQVCTHKYVEQSVRRSLLKRMDEFFPELPLKDPWDKVYDEQVLNRSQQWTLYGSRKNDEDSLPYKIAYVLKYSNDGIKVDSGIPDINIDLMKTLSLRDEKPETIMTEEGKALYGKSRNTGNEDVRISGGKPRVGRPAQRSEKPGSRGSSPNGRIFAQLSVETRDTIKAHVMNLNPERADSYERWVQVALCLHNIHPDLLDVFLDFSSQDEKKYNEADCIQKWNSLTFRNDGDRMGEGTLRYWSREDDREGYDEIEKMNVNRLVEKARECTEHDVAAVIYARFRDAYKCSDFRNNIWYRWTGHIWRETDSGIDLLMKLSKQVAGIFFDRSAEIGSEMSQRELRECNGEGEGKKDCGVCEYCKLDNEKSDYHKVFTQLKKTAFKANIMKECRELFFDEEFTKKIDANKELTAFNNGILDMTTENFVFRDGKPEDYISFSTGIDYEPTRNHYEYPAWPEVEMFINKVLPDREVREYFMKHLSTNLSGGNLAQKFHIMTGSGSNGKSMIMNLLAKALGDYSCTVPISLITQKRKSSGSAAPEVARLKGRRFVTMQEPDESIALNTGLMKELTSGEKVFARDLFKSGSEFEIQAKFHLACNDKPKINTTDGGTWRRLVVINFTSKFVPTPMAANEFPLDESIQFKVNSVEWATAFLSYMVHILKEGKGLRKLNTPSKVMEYTSEYRNENDGISKFMSEKIVLVTEEEDDMKVDRNTLRRVFKQWKDENEQKMLSVADLEKRIELQYGKMPKGGWTKFKIEV
jgi:P4 family phage/plasmid primase-like protien